VHRVAHLEGALLELADVGDEVLVGTLGVPDLEEEALALDDATSPTWPPVSP